MRSIVLSMVAVLAGCATADEVRQRPATSVHYSSKAPEDLAECVLDAWQNVTFGGQAYPSQLSKLGERYSVVTTPPNPSELVDIAPEGDRTRAEFRHGPTVHARRYNRYRDALSGCL